MRRGRVVAFQWRGRVCFCIKGANRGEKNLTYLLIELLREMFVFAVIAWPQPERRVLPHFLPSSFSCSHGGPTGRCGFAVVSRAKHSHPPQLQVNIASDWQLDHSIDWIQSLFILQPPSPLFVSVSCIHFLLARSPSCLFEFEIQAGYYTKRREGYCLVRGEGRGGVRWVNSGHLWSSSSVSLLRLLASPVLQPLRTRMKTRGCLLQVPLWLLTSADRNEHNINMTQGIRVLFLT